MSVITALTSQNTTRVSDIHYVPAEFVRKQIEDVIDDIRPNCIKTGPCADKQLISGMLANADIICTVAEALKKYRISCVVDPVYPLS